MLNRMIEHQSLVAHWVIVAGFLLYVRPYQKSTHLFWFLLNVIAVLIHAYLALMLLALWAAFLFRHIFIDTNISIKQAISLIVINIVGMIFVAWLSGYFVIPFASIMDAGGYGMNSMNLLAPFRPSTGSLVAPGGWSRFLPPVTKPQVKIINFGDYINYAATHHMSVNLGYFARQDYSEYMKTGKQLLIQASQGKFSKDTIYIILNPRIATLLKARLIAGDMIATTGSYVIIIPGSQRIKRSETRDNNNS